MSNYELIYLISGILIGWITKIPIFLKHYREWETTRDQIIKWMDSQK